MHLLALDWRKAFDSINPSSLLQALRIFGIPDQFVDMIQSIYTDRCFRVSECGVTSERHLQQSGICQGCPLSPFLFVIVMTVLMDIARKDLSPLASAAIGEQQLFDILYADDTIILGTSTCHVEEFAAAVGRAGLQFGMTLHWGKTQALSVCTDARLRGPQGDLVDDTGSLVYLGGLLTANGRPDSEISRKIGAAIGDFKNLSAFWSHAGLGRSRKLELFHALVVSKLLYGLSTLWLTKAQRRRLDGFYCRCLRRILRIPAAFVSRVSNKIVFERAGATPLSDQILHRQLLLLGKVVRAPEDSLLKQCVFSSGTLLPQIGQFVRRVGRPRQDWSTQVLKAGLERCGHARWQALLSYQGPDAEIVWKQELQKCF